MSQKNLGILPYSLAIIAFVTGIVQTGSHFTCIHIYSSVTRDRLLVRWPKEGRGPVPAGTAIGSGYPGDPATKQYIRMCMDPIVGFPPLVRSSWATAQILLEERGVKFVCLNCQINPKEDEVEVEEAKNRGKKRLSEGSAKIFGFFKSAPRSDHHTKRQPFFVTAGLSSVENF
ncbi:hypothetical protein ACTXT7_007224 [Hymenolepis weldensis]